jgi:hypothetical protein
VIDIVAWHDGDVWRVAVDTQALEGSNNCGKLADFVPLTNYRYVQIYVVVLYCRCYFNCIYCSFSFLSWLYFLLAHNPHFAAGYLNGFHFSLLNLLGCHGKFSFMKNIYVVLQA